MLSALQMGAACAGALFAGGVGYFGWGAYAAYVRRTRHGRSVQGANASGAYAEGARSASSQESSRSVDERVISFAVSQSRLHALGKGKRFIPERFAQASWVEQRCRFAGLKGLVTCVGFWEARLRLCAGFALAGFLLGLAISLEFAALLALAGAVVGWRLLLGALVRRSFARVQELEQHLPEMLDVIALGMRSGLSFDKSVSLYAQHFSTALSASFAVAQQQWSCGLVPRDEALRDLAAAYDSPLFTRVIEGFVRSLRFGSPMVEGLESASREARVSYRAKRQEQAAKTPVKMMIPTGTLILPAMLILVLGPVLLELMGGF